MFAMQLNVTNLALVLADSAAERWSRKEDSPKTHNHRWYMQIVNSDLKALPLAADCFFGQSSSQLNAHCRDVTTAVDAGFWTAMRIKNMRIRDLASIIFTIYYPIAAKQADEKVQKVRAVLTVDHPRVAWNKSTTTHLSFFTSLV